MDKIELALVPFIARFCAARGIKLEYIVTSRYRPGSVNSYHSKPGMAMDFYFKRTEPRIDYAPMSDYDEFFDWMYRNGWPGGLGIDNTEINGNVHIHADARHLEGKARYFFFEDYGKHKQPYKGGGMTEIKAFKAAVNREELAKRVDSKKK